MIVWSEATVPVDAGTGVIRQTGEDRSGANAESVRATTCGDVVRLFLKKHRNLRLFCCPAWHFCRHGQNNRIAIGRVVNIA
jgi:hypothetical protein